MSEQITTPDVDDVEDFDAFWSTQNRKGRAVRIFGEVVTLPPALPLQFELEARKLQRSKRAEDVTKLVSILFGQGAYDSWVAAGLDIEQFQLLLAWAPRVVAGQKGADGNTITLAEVKAELAEKDAEADPT